MTTLVSPDDLVALGFARAEYELVGEVVRLDLTAERFLLLEGAVRAVGPSSLKLRNIDLARAEKIAASAALASVASLHLGGRRPVLDTRVARALAQSTTLRGVRSLDVSGHPLGDEGVVALLRAPWASSLRFLDVGHTKLGDAGAIDLARMGTLAELEELRVFGTTVGDAGVGALAMAAPALRRICLNNTRLTVDGLATLLACRAGSALETLELLGCKLGPRASSIVAGSTSVRSLVRLNLADCAVGDEGVASLVSAPFERLAELSLDDGGIGPAGARALRSAPWIEQLEDLRLSANPLGVGGGKALGDARLPRLRVLGLIRTELGDDGAIALARGAFHSPLAMLLLAGNNIGSVGLKAVLDAGALRSLETLYFDENPLGDDGAALLASRLPPTLTCLSLCGCGIGDRGASALLAAIRSSPEELVLSENAISGAVRDAFLARFPLAVMD
jgi:Ran GTPase-activating protein (RanGAP) involved in mRNA processing and transport